MRERNEAELGQQKKKQGGGSWLLGPKAREGKEIFF